MVKRDGTPAPDPCLLDMAPEDELCLLLARGRLPPGADERAQQLLAGALAWNRVLERLRAHEILPLVCSNLKRLGFPSLPQPVQAELADYFRSNALRNALFATELARVLSLLGAAQVPAMALKGVPLAESLYGDAAHRVSADIDILVPTKYFAQAFQILLSSGYVASFTQPSLAKLVARFGKDCGLSRQDGRFAYPVQLHCGLIWGGPVERDLLEEIWSEAERKTFHGVQAFALSAEWEFLYLAVHAARHGLHPLKWLVDLDRICWRGTIDWGDVKEKARLLGWEETIRSSLAGCASLFDTPIPPIFSVTMSRARRGFDAAPRYDLQILQETLFSIRLLKPLSQKLRFLAVRLFIPTPADCQFVSLPSWLFLLYFPLRFFRVVSTTAGWLVLAGANRLLPKLGFRARATS